MANKKEDNTPEEVIDEVSAPKSYPKTLTEAVLQVMAEVRNIEKNLNVGGEGNSYKGVSDKDVKYAMSRAFIRAGLVAFPVDIEEELRVTEWEEVVQFGNNPAKIKKKFSYFTKVKATFELTHVSGESRIIKGLGHGVDTQDKSAGKATTYALKNALLYTFMIATGTIDDADKDHSDDLPTPERPAQETKTKPASKQPEKPKDESLPWLKNEDKEAWDAAIKYMNEGGSLKAILAKKQVSEEDQKTLLKAFNPKKADPKLTDKK